MLYLLTIYRADFRKSIQALLKQLATSIGRKIAMSAATDPKASSSGNGAYMHWETLSDKDAKTLDNFELGKVKQIASDYIFTEKGMVKKEKFFVPRRFADRFDGKTLWFSITEAQAENEFRREIPPGPGEYAKRYTTVEKHIVEKTIETGPTGEKKERVEERTE